MNHGFLRPLAMAAISVFLSTGCEVGAGSDSSLTEPGVSSSLAGMRRERISDVSYKITLSIPSEKDSAITGRETISFLSTSRGSVPLDFAPAEGEHIILKARKGRNTFDLDFVSDDRFLNRNEEYLYSLFVPAHARSVFPCFDQPDMKARYTLSLEVPEDWTAVSNTAAVDTMSLDGGRKRIDFAGTEPISTYLFAFVAGKWSKATSSEGGRDMTVYYRETDSGKVAQIPDIFSEVRMALAWMEDYTGINMPFSKYDFVIVPQ
ncbi:MAG: aminopeptidase, partial [Bacteroidales bacterium]|nr:aminopeptidase [Bacteroidales bacterium]